MFFTQQATTRELEVLSLLSEGKSAKEIASDLYISTHTVESHKRNLISKIKARNTLHMVVKAIRMGIVCLMLTFSSTVMAQETDIVWENNFGGTDEETLKDMFETSDKGFLLVGNSRSDELDAAETSNCSSFSGTNNLIIKLSSSSGQVSWNKTIGGSICHPIDASNPAR